MRKIFGLSVAFVFVSIFCIAFAKPVNAMPYYSYASVYAEYAKDGVGEDFVQDTDESLSGVATDETFIAAYKYDASGKARAYADATTGIIKTYASSSYFLPPYNGSPLSWTIYIPPAGVPVLYQPSTVGTGVATAYTNSIWQVLSDTLPTGEPVSLEVSLDISGSIQGDPKDPASPDPAIDDGNAGCQVFSWLNDASSIWWTDPFAMEYLDSTAVMAEGVGIPPVVGYETYIDNIIGSINETRTGSFSTSVGAIVVFETFMRTYASTYNDGILYEPVRADFYNTLTSTLTSNTPGVTLVPYGGAPPAPVPEPSTMLLLGSGLIGLVGLRGRLKAKTS